MNKNVQLAQESDLDRLVTELTEILSVLDELDLQVPAVHVANAIDCLKRIDD